MCILNNIMYSRIHIIIVNMHYCGPIRGICIINGNIELYNYVHIEYNSSSNSIRIQKGKTQMLPVNKLECHVCVCDVSSDCLCPLQDGNMTFFTFVI